MRVCVCACTCECPFIKNDIITFLSVFIIIDVVFVLQLLPAKNMPLLHVGVHCVSHICACVWLWVWEVAPHSTPSPPHYSLHGPQSFLLQDKLCAAVTSHYKVYKTIQGFSPLRPTDQTHTHTQRETHTHMVDTVCNDGITHHTLFSLFWLLLKFTSLILQFSHTLTHSGKVTMYIDASALRTI